MTVMGVMVMMCASRQIKEAKAREGGESQPDQPAREREQTASQTRERREPARA